MSRFLHIIGKSYDFISGKLTKFDDKMKILEVGTIKNKQ